SVDHRSENAVSGSKGPHEKLDVVPQNLQALCNRLRDDTVLLRQRCPVRVPLRRSGEGLCEHVTVLRKSKKSRNISGRDDAQVPKRLHCRGAVLGPDRLHEAQKRSGSVRAPRRGELLACRTYEGSELLQLLPARSNRVVDVRKQAGDNTSRKLRLGA